MRGARVAPAAARADQRARTRRTSGDPRQRARAGGRRAAAAVHRRHAQRRSTPTRSPRCCRPAATCETMADSVVAAALERGSRDNVTALLVRYDRESDASWLRRRTAMPARIGTVPHHRPHRPRRDGRCLLGAGRGHRPARSALKVLMADLEGDPETRARFHREAKAAARLLTRTSSRSSTPAKTRGGCSSRWSCSQGAPLAAYLEASRSRRARAQARSDDPGV